MLSTKSPAHKRPVFDRAVCGFAAIDIAAVLWLSPKRIAAIQLPRTKRSFPKPRAASGWLPAAAFQPANPQAEASAKFLVPFFKKGTSFRDGNTRPRTPRYPANATVYTPRVPRAPHSAALATRSRLSAPRALHYPALATRPRPQQTTVEARSPHGHRAPFFQKIVDSRSFFRFFLEKVPRVRYNVPYPRMVLPPDGSRSAPAPALPRQRSL